MTQTVTKTEGAEPKPAPQPAASTAKAEPATPPVTRSRRLLLVALGVVLLLVLAVVALQLTGVVGLVAVLAAGAAVAIGVLIQRRPAGRGSKQGRSIATSPARPGRVARALHRVSGGRLGSSAGRSGTGARAGAGRTTSGRRASGGVHSRAGGGAGSDRGGVRQRARAAWGRVRGGRQVGASGGQAGSPGRTRAAGRLRRAVSPRARRERAAAAGASTAGRGAARSSGTGRGSRRGGGSSGGGLGLGSSGGRRGRHGGGRGTSGGAGGGRGAGGRRSGGGRAGARRRSSEAKRGGSGGGRLRRVGRWYADGWRSQNVTPMKTCAAPADVRKPDRTGAFAKPESAAKVAKDAAAAHAKEAADQAVAPAKDKKPGTPDGPWDAVEGMTVDQIKRARKAAAGEAKTRGAGDEVAEAGGQKPATRGRRGGWHDAWGDEKTREGRDMDGMSIGTMTGMTHLPARLVTLMDSIGATVRAMQLSAAQLEDRPVNQAFRDEVARFAEGLQALARVPGEITQAFEQDHADDLTRHRSPRPGEQEWDIQA